MIVIKKFGGTSLATKESRKIVINKIKEGIEKGEEIVVVVSAIGRNPANFATDTLIETLNENVLNEEYVGSQNYKKNLDLMMSQGENISSIILVTMLESIGIKAKYVNATQLGITTDDKYGDANIIATDNEYLNELIKKGIIPVVTGFQGINQNNEITTLGRGGSDLTAVVLGNMLEANYVEIYTDVDGVMNDDPKVNKAAKKYKTLTHSMLLELCNLGAKVLHVKAAIFAKNNNINIKVLNTFTNDSGTYISSDVLNVFEKY